MALMMSSLVGPISPVLRSRATYPLAVPNCIYRQHGHSFPAQPSVQSRPLRRRVQQVRASSSSPEATTSGSGVAGPSPYVPLVAAVAFAAVWVQKYSAQREYVLIALAAVALAQSALGLVKAAPGDWVSNIAAPAVLAWNALNLQFHYMEVAIAVFGYYLCKNLPGPALAWVATLAAGLYYRMGAEWYAAAYAVVAGFKLIRDAKNSKVALQMAPPVIASAWALYKKCPLTWTIILMLTQIAGSAFGLGKSILQTASSEEPNIA